MTSLDLGKMAACYRWFRFPKVIALVIPLVLVPLIIHYYLSKISTEEESGEIHKQYSQLDDLDKLQAADLRMRIEEMLRIKGSVSDELRDLESRRRKLQSEISQLTQKSEDLKTDYARQEVELDRLHMSISQAQYAQKEAQERISPPISAPKRILPRLSDSLKIAPPEKMSQVRNCRSHLCFDYSRCSLTSGFPVYFYRPEDIRPTPSSPEQQLLKNVLAEALNMNVHITFDPGIACVYVVLLEEVPRESLLNYLRSLDHWNGDGRNHILLNFSLESKWTSWLSSANTGRAMIMQAGYFINEFRKGFDIIAPPLLFGTKEENRHFFYAPARRKFLLSFQGEYESPHKRFSGRKLSAPLSPNDDSEDLDNEDSIVDVLKEMQLSLLGDNFFFQFSCADGALAGSPREWSLCGTHRTRLDVLKDSTFSLLVAPSDYSVASCPQISTRALEALQTGAIPVILGNHLHLPFDEFIDWKRVAVLLPKSRISELHYYIRSLGDSDIMAMRHRGRQLFEKYFSMPHSIISTTLALLRNRIGIPPLSVRDESSPSIFNDTFRPLIRDSAPNFSDGEADENLGPVGEAAFPSPVFRRNLTATNVDSYVMWNEYFDPFMLYPHMPFDPILPSEAKFIGSSFGFRPIGQGAGGSGKEFSEALGGNSPREQFTIVILTYEREAVLIDSLNRLRNLPYLNKVIVVWNSDHLPSRDLPWPQIGVPILVIKAKKNSLNNRFLPFDAIETEAVLSVDDDAHLRHDEIVFGFRVWREARDRIVGFPGRFHAWYKGWHYNSNYTCELSMVLTGAAFIHKYYLYMYTYSMSQSIRDKVDEYMNCEDIAMNFLVSHITRKPPLKVTSRWTFRCPGCPVSLSEEDSHFQERHRCMEHFTSVYGYMPLLNTQFRADSVLFKTRIPHDKQKCFKFI